MRQRMWVWVSIGMFVVTMLISGVVLQGGDGSLLGQELRLAQDGGGGCNFIWPLCDYSPPE